MAGSKYIPDFLEKYINKDVALQQKQSNIMKADKAVLPKTPAPDTTQGDYFMGKGKGYYVPGAPIEREGLLIPKTGSTISQARLDVISPKITRTEDNQADHEKNIAILDDIQKQGKLTPEDQQFIKDQQAKGVSKYDIAGDLIAKKRYQLGTRQVVIPTIPGKPASLAVNKKNLYSVYDKSEIDNFINTQPPLSPETQEWVKQQKQSGKTSEDIKSELFSQHLQRNLENYVWSKKGMIEKAIDTAGLAVTAGANDIVLGTGAFLLDLLSKVPGAGGLEQGQDFLNKLSESNKSNLARNLGINPGDQVGGSDISYEGAKIAGAILSLFVPTGAGSVLKYVGKLPKVEKGLEFLGSFGNTKVVKTFKEASEAISKYLANPNNAKNAARAEWVLKSLKESTIMSGRTSVRSGEVPSAGEFATQTAAFAAGDLAFKGVGGYLGKMLPERLQLTNIVNAGDLQKSSERLARLYGKEADVTDVARWNLDRGIRGTGKQQRQQINDWVEKSMAQKEEAISAVKQTFSDDTVKSLQKALAEKVDIYTEKGIATAGNEEKVSKFRRLIGKEKLTMKEVEEARGLLAENLFTKQGTMKEVASKEGWQKVWVDASKWMENKLPGIRAVNKDIEVGIAQAQAIAKKEATNAAKQIASYLGFSGLTGTGVGVYTGDWKKGLAATTLGFGSTQLVKMLRSPLVMSNIAYYLNKLSPQSRKVMNALKNGDRIGVDDVLKVVDEIKLLPPPSGKPLSVQNVKGEVVAPTGVMTGKVSDKDIIRQSNLGNTKSKYTGETVQIQPQEIPKQEVKKGLLKTLSNSKQSQKGKVGEVKSSIPSKKVNNPIIQKLAKKQETPKTPEDWTKKDFTKATETKSVDKFGNTVMQDSKANRSIQVNGKNYKELDLPESTRMLYTSDGKFYEYKNGKMIPEGAKTPQVEGKTVNTNEAYKKSVEKFYNEKALDEVDVNNVENYVRKKTGIQDLEFKGSDGDYIYFEKKGVKVPSLDYRFDYKINASTGELITKKSSLPLSQKSEGKTLKDNLEWTPSSKLDQDIFYVDRNGIRQTEFESAGKNIKGQRAGYTMEEYLNKNGLSKDDFTLSKGTDGVDGLYVLNEKGLSKLEKLRAGNKPKPSLPLSSKSEVKYSKPIEKELEPLKEFLTKQKNYDDKFAELSVKANEIAKEYPGIMGTISEEGRKIPANKKILEDLAYYKKLSQDFNSLESSKKFIKQLGKMSIMERKALRNSIK